MSIKKRLLFSLGNAGVIFILLCILNLIYHDIDWLQESATWTIAWTIGTFVGLSLATIKKNLLIKILLSIATILLIFIIISLIAFYFNITSSYIVYMAFSYGLSVIIYTIAPLLEE